MHHCHSPCYPQLPAFLTFQVWIRCPSHGHPECPHHSTAIAGSWERRLFIFGSQLYLKPLIHV